MKVFRRLKAKQYSSPPTPPAHTFFKKTSLLTKSDVKILDSIKDDSPLAATASQKQQQNAKKTEAKKKAKDAKQAKQTKQAKAKQAKAKRAKQAKQTSSEEEQEEEHEEENEEEEEKEIDEEIDEEVEDENLERKKKRHRCTSHAYHAAEKAAVGVGNSPESAKKIARAAYKKAAEHWDQLWDQV